MIEGQEQLQKLLTRLEANPDQDPELRKTVSAELAAASYYTAWVMRLEGATAEEWKPEAEQARQQFRLLAERGRGRRRGGRSTSEELGGDGPLGTDGPRHAQGQAAAQEVQRLQESQPTQTPAVPGPLEGPSEETRRGRPEDDPEDQQRGPERTPGRWIMIAVTAHRHRKGTGTFFGLGASTQRENHTGRKMSQSPAACERLRLLSWRIVWLAATAFTLTVHRAEAQAYAPVPLPPPSLVPIPSAEIVPFQSLPSVAETTEPDETPGNELPPGPEREQAVQVLQKYMSLQQLQRTPSQVLRAKATLLAAPQAKPEKPGSAKPAPAGPIAPAAIGPALVRPHQSRRAIRPGSNNSASRW